MSCIVISEIAILATLIHVISGVVLLYMIEFFEARADGRGMETESVCVAVSMLLGGIGISLLYLWYLFRKQRGLPCG